MSKAYERKRQPERVRQSLLDCAARLTVEQGIAGVSVQAVADAAGVTKGGLFHHFPSKQMLLDAVFDDALSKLDREIDSLISQDCEAYGRFTRAYVEAAFADIRSESESPWASISDLLFNDTASNAKWDGWIKERLLSHETTDNDLRLEIIRHAVDGLWLSHITAGASGTINNVAELHECLIQCTQGKPL